MPHSVSRHGLSLGALTLCLLWHPPVAQAEDLLPGNPITGQLLFNLRCAQCHSTAPGINKAGPTLYEVIGRRSGAVPDFRYSPAMIAKGVIWNSETLDQYLTRPRKYIPGTTDSFPGFALKQSRTDVIAFLETLTQLQP